MLSISAVTKQNYRIRNGTSKLRNERGRRMTAERFSRREFLKVAGYGLGSLAISGSLSGCTAQDSKSSPEDGGEVETPSFSYGDIQAAEGRVLVAYATRTGSTVGVASAIGQALAERGFAVDIKPMKGAPRTGGYQKIILGSAINGANWLPEAIEYVQNNQEPLSQTPVALFSVHIMNLGDDETSTRNRKSYLDEVRPYVKTDYEEFFAGIGMDQDLSKLTGWIYQIFSIGGVGDCRDWEKIRGWAKVVW